VAETIPNVRRASYLEDFLQAIRSEVGTKHITQDSDLHEAIATGIVKYCDVNGVRGNDGAVVLNAGHLAFAILSEVNAQLETNASRHAPASLGIPLDGRRARSRFLPR
jgi:hypothetical protein